MLYFIIFLRGVPSNLDIIYFSGNDPVHSTIPDFLLTEWSSVGMQIRVLINNVFHTFGALVRTKRILG